MNDKNTGLRLANEVVGKEAAKKEFAAILKMDRRNEKTEGDKHFAVVQDIRDRLRLFVYHQPFGDMTKAQILKLCHMVYIYQPCALHVFLRKCGEQHERINPPKPITDADH
jgi:hypothetical protein